MQRRTKTQTGNGAPLRQLTTALKEAEKSEALSAAAAVRIKPARAGRRAARGGTTTARTTRRKRTTRADRPAERRAA